MALVAAGEMGSALGRRLVESGARVLTSLAGRSEASGARARDAGMEPVADGSLAGAGIFLSVAPPGAAVAIAERLAPLFTAAVRKPLYVECNAVSPRTVERIGGMVEATGAEFVDAGIIGAPPQPGRPGPSIYCSGPAAAKAAILGEYGLRVRVMDGPVGAASALKMSYAGITKGLIAVASAMALGATRAGVEDALLQELSESQAELLQRLRTMIPGVYSKAYRWVAEMEEIAAFLEGVGEAGDLYRGAAGLYQDLASEFPDGADIAALERFFQRTNGR